jgi:hypothetical protein
VTVVDVAATRRAVVDRAPAVLAHLVENLADLLLTAVPANSRFQDAGRKPVNRQNGRDREKLDRNEDYHGSAQQKQQQRYRCKQDKPEC